MPTPWVVPPHPPLGNACGIRPHPDTSRSKDVSKSACSYRYGRPYPVGYMQNKTRAQEKLPRNEKGVAGCEVFE